MHSLRFNECQRILLPRNSWKIIFTVLSRDVCLGQRQIMDPYSTLSGTSQSACHTAVGYMHAFRLYSLRQCSCIQLDKGSFMHKAEQFKFLLNKIILNYLVLVRYIQPHLREIYYIISLNLNYPIRVCLFYCICNKLYKLFRRNN